MNPLVLAAPLTGWVSRLDEVPDPAFAQGMVGDGVAIDPVSNELCAPCDGVVVAVHRARHACTLRAGDAEILLHIGVDSVELRGEGFQVLVADGQRVRTGDPLIRFDMELVSRRAKSVHTPVLLVGGDGLVVLERVVDQEVTAGSFLLAIGREGEQRVAEGSGSKTAPAPAAPATVVTAVRRARILLPDGLHARPAAAVARRARLHEGVVTIACRERSANGKSMASLLTLGAQLGDELTITASGQQPEVVVSELVALVAPGQGDAAHLTPAPVPVSAPASATPAPARAFAPGEEVVLAGSPAAAGLAIGRAVRLADVSSAPEIARDGAGAAIERGRLDAALAEVRREIEQTVGAAEARRDAVAADIFRAHLDLLDDPELHAAAERELAAGRSAAWAWRTALQELAAVLRGLDNPLLAERTGDLGDLERQTLARLAGHGGRMPAELPEGAVLIADEILPSELAAAPAGRLAGLCTARGGATSHVAILAAGMGVPAVVALGDAALRVPDGAPVIVDGHHGRLRVFPAAATREAVHKAISARATRRRAHLAAAHQPARTLDGVEIAVHANLGALADATVALSCGAEGSGLLRTELLFLNRQRAPSEDEQAAHYQQIASALGGRPLVIRTFDGGGDKPLPYLPQAREDNPALGVRGVRLALRHPELLRAQLRAILRVQPAGVCRIMVPMIASLAELRAVRAMLDEERRALAVAAPVQLGAMIEVPVAAVMAEALAREADFFSIGTNDLEQYALAVDRGNRELATGLGSLHPGVLRLIASTVSGARTRDRPVSVCGGAAGEPSAVPILLGLGVRTLSIAPALVPEIKAVLRTLSLARCVEVATAALGLESSDEVRALVTRTWPGLADTIDALE